MKHAAHGAPSQPHQPLLPGRMHRLAVVIIAVCAGITAVLGALVYHRKGAHFLDRKIDNVLHHTIGKHPGILHPLAGLGELVPVTLMAAVLAVAFLLARRWDGAVMVAVGVAAASVVTEYLIKPIVGRRFGTGSESFPSGHATGMFALATAFWVLVVAVSPRLKLPAWLRRVLTAVAFLFAASVPVAMVGLNHHYFTDIVAGAAVGTAVVLLTALVLDGLTQRQARKPRQSPSDSGTTAHGSGSEHATVGA